MIRKVSIENFRGFESIDIPDMSRISLISGRNNVGKSSILEALFLMMDHTSNDSFAKISGFRGSVLGGAASLWSPLFYELDTDRQIRIIMEEDQETACLCYRRDNEYLPFTANGIPEDVLAAFRLATKNTYSLLFTYNNGNYHEEGHFFLNGMNALREMKSSLPGNEIKSLPLTRWLNTTVTRLSDAVMNDIGDLELKGKKGDVIEILQELDPAIEDILTLSVQGAPQLYLRVSGKHIPVQYAGDGVLKLLQVCIAAMEIRNGLILIDEIETGLHYSMYGKLWAILEKISAVSNCQIIATTHSYEMISAVPGNIKNRNDFSYYRIGHGQHGHMVYRYDLNMLGSALEAEMEVR